MAKLIKSDILVNYLGVSFKIHLPSELVSIEGDSGTGKSFFKQALLNLGISTNEYICLDWKSKIFIDVVLAKPMSDYKGKIILIDNADIILKPIEKYRDIFKNDKHNQYILLSRRGEDYGVSMDSVGQFVRTKKGIVEAIYMHNIMKKIIV